MRHINSMKMFKIEMFSMKLSYNERTGEVTEKSMSGNEGQSKKLRKGANVIVATPGQLVHYMKSNIIRNGS